MTNQRRPFRISFCVWNICDPLEGYGIENRGSFWPPLSRIDCCGSLCGRGRLMSSYLLGRRSELLFRWSLERSELSVRKSVATDDSSVRPQSQRARQSQFHSPIPNGHNGFAERFRVHYEATAREGTDRFVRRRTESVWGGEKSRNVIKPRTGADVVVSRHEPEGVSLAAHTVRSAEVALYTVPERTHKKVAP